MPGAVLAAVVLLGVVVTSGRTPGRASPTEAGQTPAASLARRTSGDPLAQGRVDAPVVMVMWSDFQCPFCGRFARETEPELVRRYVDSGVLRIEWRDFPYIGPQSLPAAIAGRAAAAQGRFWQFNRVVYSAQRRPRSSDYDAAHLRAYAQRAGLDLSRYDADVKAQIGVAQVRSDLEEGTQLGITGTPAFFINGAPVMGAQPLDAFAQVIEQAAAAAGHPAT